MSEGQRILFISTFHDLVDTGEKKIDPRKIRNLVEEKGEVHILSFDDSRWFMRKNRYDLIRDVINANRLVDRLISMNLNVSFSLNPVMSFSDVKDLIEETIKNYGPDMIITLSTRIIFDMKSDYSIQGIVKDATSKCEKSPVIMHMG